MDYPNKGRNKKGTWKRYMASRTIENYGKYKEQRKKVKHMVAEAKKASWTDFGNKRKSEIVLQNDEIFKKE